MRPRGRLEDDHRCPRGQATAQISEQRLARVEPIGRLAVGEELVQRQPDQHQVGLWQTGKLGPLEIRLAGLELHRRDQPGLRRPLGQRPEDVERRGIALQRHDLEARRARPLRQLRQAQRRRAQAGADVEHPPHLAPRQRVERRELRQRTLDLRQIAQEEEAQAGRDRLVRASDGVALAGVELAQRGDLGRERGAFAVGSAEQPRGDLGHEVDPARIQRTRVGGRHGSARVITRREGGRPAQPAPRFATEKHDRSSPPSPRLVDPGRRHHRAAGRRAVVDLLQRPRRAHDGDRPEDLLLPRAQRLRDVRRASVPAAWAARCS